jgi:hypothetical protein
MWSHKVFTRNDDPLYQELSRLATEGEWDVSIPVHCDFLEQFEARSGVLFTSEGPYWVKREVILSRQRVSPKKPDWSCRLPENRGELQAFFKAVDVL